MKVKSLSRIRLLATPWTAAYQAPLSMGFSRQEYWSGVPLPSLSIISSLQYFNQFHMSHLSVPAAHINPCFTKQPCEGEPFRGSLLPSVEASASLAEGSEPFVI